MHTDGRVYSVKLKKQTNKKKHLLAIVIDKCTFLLDIFWKIKEDQESELVNSL